MFANLSIFVTSGVRRAQAERRNAHTIVQSGLLPRLLWAGLGLDGGRSQSLHAKKIHFVRHSRPLFVYASPGCRTTCFSRDAPWVRQTWLRSNAGWRRIPPGIEPGCRANCASCGTGPTRRANSKTWPAVPSYSSSRRGAGSRCPRANALRSMASATALGWGVL